MFRPSAKTTEESFHQAAICDPFWILAWLLLTVGGHGEYLIIDNPSHKGRRTLKYSQTNTDQLQLFIMI